MKTLTSIVLFVWGCAGISAQPNSHSGKVPWVDGKFPDKKGNYEYMVARGEGRFLKGARDDAFTSLLMDLGNNAGAKIDSRTVSEIKSSLNYSNNFTDYQENTSVNNTYNIEREGFNASFSKVGEYYEFVNGAYHLWELYEVSESGQSFKPYIPQYTDRYGFSAAWKSVLLPGWGQFYKGDSGKGFLFLISEAALVSGAIYFENKRADNARKSLETTNMALIKEYRKRADDWELYRNIGIGAAAGVYLWNVFDAALSKGKVRYISENVHLKASQTDGNSYFGLAVNF